MPCTITIQNVTGDASLSSITVTGNVTGSAPLCNAVTVSIHCTGPGTAKHQNVPVVGGQWQTTFTAQEVKMAGCLECSNPSYPITAHAECADPAVQCVPADQLLTQIPCSQCCPTVSVAVIEGDCDSLGRRNVTFQVNTTSVPGCPQVLAQMDFGDGTWGPVFTVPPDNAWTGSHAYVLGSYVAKVHIVIPTGCEDIPITVAAVRKCPCPTITLASLSVKGCVDSSHTAIITVTATVSPATAGCQLKWMFDDGYQISTQIPNNANSFSDTQSHEYSSAGPHSVSVTAVCGACSESATRGFDVQNCGGDGGGGGGCQWWDPRCWGSLCGALLAAAMAALIASGLLFFIAGCTVLTPTVLAGPLVAAMNALFASALFIAAVVLLALSLFLLTIWYLVCSKLPSYDFCATLHQVIIFIAWVILLQIALGFALALAGDIGCLIGLVFTFASWATVNNYLILLEEATCSH